MKDNVLYNAICEIKNKWLIQLILIFVTTFLAIYFQGGYDYSLSIPLFYSGDGLSYAALVQRLILEHSYYNSSLLGYPFGAELYDYPTSDWGHYFILLILSVTGLGTFEIVNMYYLLGFPVTAATSYYVLRKISLSKEVSSSMALLFTFLPFHFLRQEHLFYTWYFVIPIYILYAYRIYTLDTEKNIVNRKELFICAMVLLLISTFGVYYSFFGSLIISFSGFLAFVRYKSIKSVFVAAVACCIIFISIGVSIYPSYKYEKTNGENSLVAKRVASESEVYGLKIAQLILPRPNHRLPKLAKINNEYSRSTPLINENATSSLGIIGALGLLLCMLSVLVPSDAKNIKNERSFFLGSICLMLLLFITIGGFSSMFATFVTPMLRGWNRFSIAIGFISFAALGILLDRIFESKYVHKVIKYSLLVSIVIFALWDQTTAFCVTCSNNIDKQYIEDKVLVSEIEELVGGHAAVYQLPYVQYPEVPSHYELAAYAHFRGYLHSDTLKWSFGVMKGRQGDAFFSEQKDLSLNEQLKSAAKLGFSAVAVDLRGYIDQGAEMVDELTKIFQREPDLINNDADWIVYKLSTNYLVGSIIESNAHKVAIERTVEPVTGVLDISAPTGALIDFTKVRPKFVKKISGLSGIEIWGRWSDAKLEDHITIAFKNYLPLTFNLDMRLQAYGKSIGMSYIVKVGLIEKELVLTGNMNDYSISFELNEMVDSIEIYVPASEEPPGDKREISLGIQSIRIME